MRHNISRRRFLGCAAAASTLGFVPWGVSGGPIDPGQANERDFPLIDFHAHFDARFPLEKAVQVAKERGVKLGVVEHGGFDQPIRNDEDLKRYIATLAAQPVYKGMQAEGLDWMKCFSKEVVAQLDYVLSDALTFPEKDGRLVRLWLPETKVGDKQDFMERYVDFNVRVISQEPIDIFANPTLLPPSIANEYDALWTKERMRRMIDAAVKHGVAIEINSRFNIPSLPFIQMAREAGVKFSFGSNAHGEDIAKLDYGVKMAKELGLTRPDMFTPAAADQKLILRRG